MLRRIVQAAIMNSKEKGVLKKKVPLKKTEHIRAFESKSSPVYKAQNSYGSLINGFKNISIGNPHASSSRTLINRRNCFTNGSGKLTIRSLSDVARAIQDLQIKNIVIVAGAGISTSSGIPDFRTPGTGLYDNLQQYKIPYPEAIFDIDYFHHNPRPFFTLAKELYPTGKYRPNYIHYFARLLHDKGILLRMYTQNIDGLERLAGIHPSRLVEAHGTFATATCVICRRKYQGYEIKDKIFEDKFPRCKQLGCPGIVKPDIVFFGEELPKRFYGYLKDMLQTDLVLVMGTSLEVQPFAGIVDNVRFNVPRVLFNREAVGPFKRNKRSLDYVAEGDLLDTMQKFVGMIDWQIDMSDLITKCEGEYKTANPPPITKKTESKEQDKLPYVITWPQNLRRNVYYSSTSESDSTSSSDNTPHTNHKHNRTQFRGVPKIIPRNKTNSRVPNRIQNKWTTPAINTGKTNDSKTEKISIGRIVRPRSGVNLDAIEPKKTLSQDRAAVRSLHTLVPRINSGENKRKLPINRVPVVPSRRAAQQAAIARQQTLFRVSSAQAQTLTYRHRGPSSYTGRRLLYANMNNNSTSDSSSSEEESSSD